MSHANQVLMDAILGEQLVEVTFILDYVQLDFNGPRLTAWTQPWVNLGAGWLKYREAGYCDALVSCIGGAVQRALVIQDKDTGEDIELYLEFANGAIISVSTKKDDMVPGQVEAAMLHTDLGWEVWN